MESLPSSLQIAVSSVLRDEHGYVWKVQCHLNVDNKGLERKEMTLRAHNVILGAGSLGSTQILLNSRANGLEISNTIGSRFTGNGDALGFCYDSSMKMNAIGSTTGKYDQVKGTSPGPCITTVIDLRNSKRTSSNNQEKSKTEKNGSIKRAKRETVTKDHVDSLFKGDIIIEDGTPPGSLAKLLKVALFLDSKKNCKHDLSKPKEFEKIFQVRTGYLSNVVRISFCQVSCVDCAYLSFSCVDKKTLGCGIHINIIFISSRLYTFFKVCSSILYKVYYLCLKFRRYGCIL